MKGNTEPSTGVSNWWKVPRPFDDPITTPCLAFTEDPDPTWSPATAAEISEYETYWSQNEN